MGLWGTGTNGSEKKPVWLSPAQQERCYATQQGWVLEHQNGTKELLVCVRGLSGAGRMAAASISRIAFASGVYAQGATRTIVLEYNEKVAVTGTPTIAVATTGALGPIVASFTGINATGTKLTFSFTVPAEVANLTIAAQTVALAGGTIKEVAAPQVNAELNITTALASAAGSKSVPAVEGA